MTQVTILHAIFFLISCVFFNVVGMEETPKPTVVAPNARLFKAIKKGRIERIKAALDAKADVNAVDPISGETPLTMALKDEKYGTASILLDYGADPNVLNKTNEAPLIVAINKKYPSVAFKLLRNGANPNVQDKNGNTPLILSVIKKNADTIRRLLKHGAKINDANNKGETPLIAAVQRKANKLVSLLLDHGADPNIGNDDPPILVMAIKQNADTIAKTLIEIGTKKGLNINAVDAKGNTALHWAAYLGKADLVLLLLNHGANAMLKNNVNETALDAAMRRKNNKVVNLLKFSSPHIEPTDMPMVGLEKEVQLDDNTLTSAGEEGEREKQPTKPQAPFNLSVDRAKLKSNPVENRQKLQLQRVMLISAVKDNNLKIAFMLLSHGTDPNIGGSKEDTPLIIAINNNNRPLVGLLLRYGANPNTKSVAGVPPLLIAVEKDDDGIARALILQKAQAPKKIIPLDINVTDAVGNTALIRATQLMKTKLVRLLLEHGANPELANRDGKSASSIAKDLNDPKDADIRYAILYARSSQSRTPLLQAIKDGNVSIVRRLLDQGANPNAKFSGIPVFSISVMSENVAIMDLLLGGGANINLQAESGDTALLYATKLRNHALVKKLLKEGADPNISDATGVTPLMIAIEHGDDAIIALLLRAKADVNQKDNQGKTALARVVESASAIRGKNFEHSELWRAELLRAIQTKGRVQNLLNHGAIVVDIKTKQIEPSPIEPSPIEPSPIEPSPIEPSPIEPSPIEPSPIEPSPIVELVQTQQVRLNARLLDKVFTRRSRKIQHLIVRGANVNYKDPTGTTPLHAAALMQDKKIIELLLLNHAAVNAVDYKFRTPVRIAIKDHNTEIVDLLIKAGAKRPGPSIPRVLVEEEPEVSKMPNISAEERKRLITLLSKYVPPVRGAAKLALWKQEMVESGSEEEEAVEQERSRLEKKRKAVLSEIKQRIDALTLEIATEQTSGYEATQLTKKRDGLREFEKLAEDASSIKVLDKIIATIQGQ